MRSYSNYSVRDLLDAFSSTAPAPGGGAAAALTAALGVSLLLMAAGIRSSRPGEPADSPELAEATDRLRSLRPAIESLVDRDAEAYTSVIAALRMPADSGDRRKALDSAMRAATDVPLDIMRASRRALREAPVVATHSIRSTHSDVGVAIELLRAAGRRDQPLGVRHGDIDRLLAGFVALDDQLRALRVDDAGLDRLAGRFEITPLRRRCLC